jgi:hypothetical protein
LPIVSVDRVVESTLKWSLMFRAIAIEGKLFYRVP